MVPRELYTTQLFGDANLVAYWRLEGNSNDSKGSNNGTDANITYGSSYGKFNQGADFNGTSSDIDLGTGLTIGNGTNPFTIVFWARIGTYKSQTLIDYNFDSSYHIKLQPYSGHFYMQRRGDYADITGLSDTTNWHHYAMVYTGSVIKAYVDGRQAVADVASVNSMTNTNKNLTFGNDGASGGFYDGSLDDVAIFTRALTLSEVYELAVGSTEAFKPSTDKSIYVVNANWDTCHDATSGTLRTAGSSYSESGLSGGIYQIERYFVPVVTSSIPDTANILEATYAVRVIAKVGTASRSYTLYDSTCSDPVIAGDYDLGGTTAYSNTITFPAGFTVGVDATWTLNATGLAAINKTGTTKFCIRETTFDVPDTPATVIIPYIEFYDGSNTFLQPVLAVLYAVTTPKDLRTKADIKVTNRKDQKSKGFIGTKLFNPSSDNSIWVGNTVFATAHDASTGEFDTDPVNTSWTQCDRANNYIVDRYFATFDTSSLPDNAVITSASFTVRVSLKNSFGTNLQSYCAYNSSHSDTIVVGDFDTGGTTEWSDTITHINAPSSGNLKFTLNATGIAGISNTGNTKLCLREKTYDVANSAPPDAGLSYVNIEFNNIGFATNKPILAVDYYIQAKNDLRTKADIKVTNRNDLESEAYITRITRRDLRTRANINPARRDLRTRANINPARRDLRTRANINPGRNYKDLRTKAELMSPGITRYVNDLETEGNIKKTVRNNLRTKAEIFSSGMTRRVKDLETEGNIFLRNSLDLRTLGFIATSKIFQVDTNQTLEAGLVAYWKFEDNSNDYWKLNDGVDTGINYVPGIVGQAAYFDGKQTNKITISPNPFGINQSAISISIWANFDSFDVNSNVYFNVAGAGTAYPRIYYNAPLNRLGAQYRIDNVTRNINVDDFSSNYSTGVPISFILVIDKNVGGIIYVNGINVGSNTSTGVSVTAGTSDMLIGKDTSTTPHSMLGWVDEMGVWNKTLSAQEITDLYNSGNGQTMILDRGDEDLESKGGIKNTNHQNLESIGSIEQDEYPYLLSLANISITSIEDLESLANINTTNSIDLESLGNIFISIITVSNDLESQGTISNMISNDLESVANIAVESYEDLESIGNILVSDNYQDIESLANLSTINFYDLQSIGEVFHDEYPVLLSLANISVTESDNLESLGNVSITSFNDLQSIGMILQDEYPVLLSLANILVVDNSQDLESLGSIFPEQMQDLESLGNINTTNYLDLESLANISITSLENLESLAAISTTSCYDLQSIGSIEQDEYPYLLSLANIVVTISEDLESLGNISVTSYEDLESQGAINTTLSEDLESIGNVIVTQSIDLLTKGSVAGQNNYDLESIGNIIATTSQDIESQGNILVIENSYDLESLANISITSYADLQSMGMILQDEYPILLSIANIVVTTSQDLQSLANISITNIEDLESIGALSNTSFNDLLSIGMIVQDEYPILLSLANIVTTNYQTLESLANIGTTNFGDLESLGNIVATLFGDLQSIGSIEQDEYPILLSLANIVTMNSNDLESIGTISTTNFYNLESIGEIVQDEYPVLLSLANIVTTNYQDLESLASINTTNSYDLESLGNISVTECNDLQSMASIEQDEYPILLSLANIVVTNFYDLESIGSIEQDEYPHLLSLANIGTTDYGEWSDVWTVTVAVIITNIKAIDGLDYSLAKTINGIPTGSIKTWNGLI